MRRLIIFVLNLSIATFCLVVHSLSQSTGLNEAIRQALKRLYGREVSFVVNEMKPGDAASGRPLPGTTDQRLDIDTNPCGPLHPVATFVQPFNSTPISDITCPDKNTYQRVQAIKLESSFHH
jgi:hypothetical protein